MEKFEAIFKEWLLNTGINSSLADIFYIGTNILAIIAISIIADWIAKRIILQTIKQIVRKSKVTWDDVIFERKVFNRLSHLAPAIVIYYLIEVAFPEASGWVNFVQKLTYMYMVFIGILVLDSFVTALHEIYKRNPISKDRPIKGYVQVVQIVIYFFGVITILAVLLGKSPGALLAGLGALAAVLMLVFRDSILGLVAGIQLSLNKMVKIGDWITMPSHNADGNVTEITLNTVKVQNFDKTITTIPTYALVSESFSNWRGMLESGGRRIKRSLYIDIRSIKFCSKELLDNLQRVHRLTDYIEKRRKEVEEYNKSQGVDQSIMANGRRMTNIGVFRKYIEEYLKHHPMINKDMTFLIRQLQTTEKGVPIEIYVFSKEKEWVKFESIQADIFDHLLAAINEFELSLYQNPSGNDISKALELRAK
ncbi:Miniconductance mechanosensitive channel [Salinivirga cyanobacteriivorans]|uniref:Mechanosensing system component YbdG n=1 Tax=Salinivirga cyanobacteriivorans TaxID=1307839 RepID=A0A0S2I3G1_9BACT|nr:mechanosensitive ion channel domain-containing protein [Salinivirga cyanobacteriivorans]ALO16937.1 Miniconductance mechanosensitive channel [Salinivirga cyanobacteriivorans]